jgi:endonuclease YncB( thermonuclease family)
MALSAIVLGTVLSVVDGDTIKVNINNCNYKVLCENMPVRFAGIDAPELKGACDKEKELALKAKQLVEENYKAGDSVNLEKAKRDNHFRLLSHQDVIATRLMQSGLAVKYNGRGAKHDWCK